MDHWTRVPDRYNPGVRGSELNKQFLIANGYNRDSYNALDKYERTDLRVLAYGGLEKTGILRELPGAIGETVSDYGESVANVATGTVRAARNTLMLVAVIAIAGAALAYRKPILKLFKGGK